MQNVYRTIANGFWVPETHWIYKESIYHLVFNRQATKLLHSLGLHDQPLLVKPFRNQVVICATYSAIHCRAFVAVDCIALNY